MKHHHTFMVNRSYNWVQSDAVSSSCPPTQGFFLLLVGREAAMMMHHGQWELWLAACNLPSRQSLLHMYSANFLRDCFSPWLAYFLCWSGHFNHLVAPLCLNCLSSQHKVSTSAQNLSYKSVKRITVAAMKVCPFCKIIPTFSIVYID